jgi:hypothetical protein
MTFPIRRKTPVYLGDIIVCLDKARPFSEIYDGRTMLGNLTHFNIKTSNMKSRFARIKEQSYTEREIAVPVYMCNRDILEKSTLNDWTELYSPITEIKNEPLQKWWPRSVFKGTQKIGDIAEEIIIEHQKFIIEFQVTYAFTTELKGLFNGVGAVIEPKKEIVESVLDPMPNIIPTFQNDASIKNERSSEDYGERKTEEKEEEKSLVVVKPPKSKMKYIFASVAITLVAAGIFFGIKWLNRNKG